MQLEPFTIPFPDRIRPQLDRLAAERHCTCKDLLAEVALRLTNESRFRFSTMATLFRILARRRAGKSDTEAWPSDPLDCLAIGLGAAIYFEQSIERQILAMTSQELDFWSGETKRTGRSFEDLIRRKVYGPLLSPSSVAGEGGPSGSV